MDIEEISQTLYKEKNQTLKVIPADFFEEENQSKSVFSRSENEKEMIIKALNLCNGNKSEAAKMLEINRKTLYNKLKLYQLED